MTNKNTTVPLDNAGAGIPSNQSLSFILLLAVLQWSTEYIDKQINPICLFAYFRAPDSIYDEYYWIIAQGTFGIIGSYLS